MYGLHHASELAALPAYVRVRRGFAQDQTVIVYLLPSHQGAIDVEFHGPARSDCRYDVQQRSVVPVDVSGEPVRSGIEPVVVIVDTAKLGYRVDGSLVPSVGDLGSSPDLVVLLALVPR